VSRDLLNQDDDATIVDEAQKRFKYAMAWESTARKNWVEDYKFANGDSENLYQWEHDVRAGREKDSLPNLTINKVRQHNLLIINDARQNKPSIRYRPVSDTASFEAAEVYEGIARHIEYQSKAQVAYDTATSFQVQAGLGALRVTTRYADENTFDQEIYIERVRDPLSILWDPDAQEADYSDARFAFVYDDMPRDEFDLKYPEFKGMNPPSVFTDNREDWISQEHVRVAEYWRRQEVPDELLLIPDDMGQPRYAQKSKIPSELLDTIKDDPTIRRRDILRSVVQHFIIVGDQVAKREEWVGETIPLIPVIGEETVIGQVMDRKGHTRAMRDSQRLLNYWYSEATAQVALQARSPWIAPALAIEGYETFWGDANTTTHSVLPYNHRDDEGQEIAPPQRTPMAATAPAFLEGMQIASQNMMEVSGQYQSQLGAPGNERTGRAIAERQRQGDNATYHYIDNLAIAIRRVGAIILDLIPKIYDQKRVMRILGEDDSERQVVLDPQAQQAYQKQQQQDGATAQEIFNPNVGKYDVQADVGPNYATARQEAWNAFVQIATANPQTMQICGDLMFQAADFPMADKIAERFKNTIPPSITGEAPPQAIQQLIQQGQQMIQAQQQQIQQLQAQLQGAAQSLTQRDLQLTARDQANLINAYKAETDRLKAMAPTGAINPQELAQLAAQLVLDTFKLPLGQVTQSSVQDLVTDAGAFGQARQPAGQQLLQGRQPGMSQQQVPQGALQQQDQTGNGGPPQNQYPQDSGIPSGAKVAPDGNTYVPDPNRPGKFMQIVGS